MGTPTPLWTQAHYDALQKAVASGVLSVSFADRSETFQSLKEMRALLAEMERALNPASRTFRVAATSKGV